MEKGGWVYIMAYRYRGGMYVWESAQTPRRCLAKPRVKHGATNRLMTVTQPVTPCLTRGKAVLRALSRPRDVLPCVFLLTLCLLSSSHDPPNLECVTLR